MVARYAIGVGLGALITFLLFFLMQAIIATDEASWMKALKGNFWISCACRTIKK